jgi:YVTN family beta-propeller protein
MKKALMIFILLVMITGLASANQLTSVAYGSKDAYIANAGNNSVSVVNTTTNTVTAVIAVGTKPSGVAVSLDGTKVYVTNEDSNTTSVIDTATNTVIATITVGTHPRCVVVSPDGSKAYVANWDSDNVSVIDTSTNTLTASIAMGSDIWGIAITPDGKYLYVPNYFDSSVSVVNTTNNSIVTHVSVRTNPHEVAVSPDGKTAYVTNYGNNSVSVINTSTYTVTSTIAINDPPYGVAVSPDGSKVYVVRYATGDFAVIDASTNTVSTTVGLLYHPEGITTTPDGKYIYATNYGSGSVTVVNASNYTDVKVINGFNEPVSLGKFIISSPTPTASFTANVTSVVEHDIRFSDASTGNPTSWSWNFGDGTTSTSQNPTHRYTNGGTYTVTLNASNAAGYSVFTRTDLIKVYVQNPSIITWSGYKWTPSNGPGLVGDGNSNGSIWVDDQDRLHLAIRYINNEWWNAELDSVNITKYGTYTWNVSSPLYQFDKNVACVFFLYWNDTEEIDIESSLWGRRSGANQFFTNQPSWSADGKTHYIWNDHNATLTDNGQPYELKIIYRPKYVQYYVNRSGSVLSQWNMTNQSEMPVSPMYYINHLWINNATAPSNGQMQEIVINSFRYVSDSSPISSVPLNASFTADKASGETH